MKLLTPIRRSDGSNFFFDTGLLVIIDYPLILKNLFLETIRNICFNIMNTRKSSDMEKHSSGYSGGDDEARYFKEMVIDKLFDELENMRQEIKTIRADVHKHNIDISANKRSSTIYGFMAGIGGFVCLILIEWLKRKP